MNKACNRTIWENYPSIKTPVNEQNLNKIEAAVDEIDDRVIAMDTSKVDLAKANELVKEILWDESDGTLTVVKMNGSKAVIDTKLEKLAVNFDYDPQTQQLIITLDDGTTQNVDLSALITQYEFLGSDTIAFELTSDGKVKAIVKEGSIEEKHLQPNYLADIKVEVAKAQQSETAANISAKAAQSYAVGGTGTRTGEDEDNAEYYCSKAAEYNANIEKRLRLATFGLNDDGELIYTDNTGNNFSVNDDGDLIWEVA